MYYNKQDIAMCSPKLQALLWQQDHIRQAARGSSALEPVLVKIIRMAREEHLAFIYISAIYDMLFFQKEFNEPRKAIQYAELFLREGQTIFEEALPTITAPIAFKDNLICCFEVIGEVYLGFYQISSKKMEQFFALYYKNICMYGSEISYYECRLKWELMCRNIEAAKKTAKHVETNPLDGRCYVCTSEPINRTRVMQGNLDAALAHIANVISGNIPQEARDRYEDCEDANAYWQYINLFETCLYDGKIELLDRVLPLAYKEILADEDNKAIADSDALAYALYGNFARWENRIKDACESIDDRKLCSPFRHMYSCLMWMTYFKLLYRSGVVRTSFPTENPISLEADSAGQYSVSDIADFFEQEADNIGLQFEKSRESFAYAERKECFHALMEMNFAL